MPLVVVLVVQQVDIAVFKPKRKTPVAANPDRKAPFQFAFKWVQSESRDVHVANGLRRVQSSQLESQTLRVL